MDLRERIEAKLEEYRQNKQRVIEQANRQVAALDGAIQALEGLLEEPEPSQDHRD